jgi:hypothetical protein
MANVPVLAYVGPYITSEGIGRFLPNSGARVRRPLPNPYYAGPLSFCPTISDRPVIGQIWPRGFGMIGVGVADPVFAYIYKSSNEVITENVPVFIDFTDAEFDAHDMWTISNPSRIEIVRTGIYVIHTQLRLESTPHAGIPILTIYKNGSPVANAILPIVGVTGGYESYSPSTILQNLEVGDYIQFELEFDSTDAADLIGGLTNTFIQIVSWG